MSNQHVSIPKMGRCGNDLEADVRILAITTKDNAFGSGGINKYFHRKYSQGKKQVLGYSEDQASWRAPAQFVEGEPVVWNHNEWGRDLFNGTLGFITEAYEAPDVQAANPGDNLSAKVLFDTGVQNVSVNDLDSMDYAYAITVHKSQGSQFRRVIIPIQNGLLLDKSLVYTAVTRGVEQVVLVGNIEAARSAVKKGTNVVDRQVGLGHMLKLVLGN